MTPPVREHAVDPIEFAAYLACREEAWLARRSPPAVPPTRVGEHALAERDRLGQLAREFLVSADAVALFGEAGSLTFGERFHVRGRWTCRAHAVFRPVSGGPLTLVTFDDGAAGDDPTRLVDVAFRRFVLTAAGAAVGNCGVLVVRRDFRQEGAHAHAERQLDYRDVTAALYSRPAGSDESYADFVVREGLEAPAFLNGPAPPAWAYTSCANRSRCRWLQRSVELPEYSVFDVPGLSTGQLDVLLSARVLDARDVPDYAPLDARQRRWVEAVHRGELGCDRRELASRLARLRYPLCVLSLTTDRPRVTAGSGGRSREAVPILSSVHVVDAPGGTPRHLACSVRGVSDDHLAFLAQLAARSGAGEGSLVVWGSAAVRQALRVLAEARPRQKPALAKLCARTWDLAALLRDGVVEVPALRGCYRPGVALRLLLPEAGVAYAEPAIADAASARHVWSELEAGVIEGVEADEAAADLRAYAASVSGGMASLVEWITQEFGTSAPA